MEEPRGARATGAAKTDETSAATKTRADERMVGELTWVAGDEGSATAGNERKESEAKNVRRDVGRRAREGDDGTKRMKREEKRGARFVGRVEAVARDDRRGRGKVARLGKSRHVHTQGTERSRVRRRVALRQRKVL